VTSRHEITRKMKVVDSILYIHSDWFPGSCINTHISSDGLKSRRWRETVFKDIQHYT